MAVDGYYPRINAAMLQSGAFQSEDVGIVSLVGKIKSQDLANSLLQFECSDGGVISMETSNAEVPEGLDMQNNVIEAIGQVVDSHNVVLFVVRELSADTRMDIYNKMLQVQHNPKYASYFIPKEANPAAMAGQ